MEITINSYSSLNEKLAFINGYLKGIAILNSTSDSGMDHWMINLGNIEIDITNTIKRGINAPSWVFELINIDDWECVIKKDLDYFFFNLLHKTQFQENLNSKNKVREFTENLTNQLKYFVQMIVELLASCQLKKVYKIKIDTRDEPYNPYFTYYGSDFAFETESNQLLLLHLGVFD